MPSLRRKSLRASRTSTPYTNNDDSSPSSDPRKEKEKTQSSLLAWIEPPPKAPVPSFEEHGFARHGVLQEMAPLGVGPSSRAKQKARALAEPNVARRSALATNGHAVAGEEVASTPEMTPAPEPEPDDTDRADDDEMLDALIPAPAEESEDEDYVPTKSKAKTAAAGSKAHYRTPSQPSHSKASSRNGTARRATVNVSPAVIRAGTLTAEPGEAARVARQRLTIAVNDAISRARTNNTPEIGVALQSLHDDSEYKDQFRLILEAILMHNPTPEQHATFRAYIKSAKKRIRREEKARVARERREARESLGSPNGSSLPVFRSSLPVAAKAKTTDPEADDNADVILDLESPPMEVEPAVVDESELDAIPALAQRTLSPLDARMPSKSPSKQEGLNGSTTPNQKAASDAEASTKAPSPADIIAALSDSDLSDVNEDIVQSGPPEPLQVNGNNSSAAAPTAKKAKPPPPRVAPGGKKSRANSVKPHGKNDKRPPPTAADLAKDAELERLREQFAERQPVRMHTNPPTSEARFDDDDELLDTESLTDSMIAMGPPIRSSQPPRDPPAPRPNLTLKFKKRVRDDSSALPSPQLDSAASTRPTTPVIAPPAAKRLKLNNGTARTKRSPMKNRDPTAHGGGGSRQLGPDDNDLEPPLSESEDFCSACKGAGEFVCCDNCPRVYHFLCCDPPRLEPPTGAFFCHECDARLNPADEHSNTFILFGPLFKELHTTNTRAFSLPPDIQDYFEDVAARPDGRYDEEVKKFPLARSSGYGYTGPDYLRTHDTEGNPVLCTQCGKSSAGKRKMLKCDFCHDYWHLDCCDPPLANPPPITLESAQRDAWKCPRHVDHDLRSGLLRQNDLNSFDDDDVDMSDAGPPARIACKVRKPKRPTLVQPTFSRGTRNNGLIDVINDTDDDTDGEGNYVFSTEDPKDFNSKVFRVPEKGLVVDFIAKVKQSRIEQMRRERRAVRIAAKRRASQKQFFVRPIQEQQAALHLAQFANKERDSGLNGMTVDALCLSLTAEAPDAVVSAMSNNGPGPLTEAKRAELVKLKELIDRVLQT